MKNKIKAILISFASIGILNLSILSAEAITPSQTTVENVSISNGSIRAYYYSDCTGSYKTLYPGQVSKAAYRSLKDYTPYRIYHSRYENGVAKAAGQCTNGLMNWPITYVWT